MVKKQKEPSLLKQWFTVVYERALTKRALRLLTKQEWGVEFLTALLIRAANVMKQSLEMTIINKDGSSFKINTVERTDSLFKDDSIFNHLDNEVRVRSFINEVNRNASR